MENNNTDKELIKWNTILKNIIIDSKELTKDLLQGINYVLSSGILLLAMGFLTIYFIIIRNPHMGLDFVLIASITITPTIILGIWNIKKYLDLRKKYSRLYQYQQKMNNK